MNNFERLRAILADNQEGLGIIDQLESQSRHQAMKTDAMGEIGPRANNPGQLIELLGISTDRDTPGLIRGEDGTLGYRFNALETKPLPAAIARLSEDKDWGHHFKSARSSQPENNGPMDNPFKTGNATKQQELIVNNRELASRMAREAGLKPTWA